MLRSVRWHKRIVACVAALSLVLIATPAIGAPERSIDATRVTFPERPSPDATTPTPAPAPASNEPSGSAVPVPVDEETEAFRAELAAKQAAIDAIKAQLDELDRQLEIAIENYNASAEELELTQETLSMTEVDLANAREAYRIQADLLRERIRRLYQDGGMTPIELLIGSKSIPDFFSRVVFLTQMGQRDGQLVGQLASQREQIEQDLLDIEAAQLRAEALEFELKAGQIEILLRIEERQQMLAGAQVELLGVLEEEAARRQLEQQELLAAILSGANDMGIQVTEGSPVETAFAYHGIPYLWGGETPSGFDCSGLLLYVYKQHGVSLPHYSGSQFMLGTRIAPADLKPGDAVFFGSPIHHVGMYIGAGYYIHAPRTGDFVKVSSLADRSDYAGARRYDWTPRIGPPLGATPPEAPAAPAE